MSGGLTRVVRHSSRVQPSTESNLSSFLAWWTPLLWSRDYVQTTGDSHPALYVKKEKSQRGDTPQTVQMNGYPLNMSIKFFRIGSGSFFLTTVRNKRTWTMSYLPLSSSGTSLCISRVVSDRLAGSHSFGGYWSAETSKPSRQDNGSWRLRSISHILGRVGQIRYADIVQAPIPCAGANISYFEVFAILHWYIWMDVIPNRVFPKVVLEI